jgi:glycosyltransferase involved in cell wall biosynthesis
MTRHCQFLRVRAIIRTYPHENHPNIPFERQIFVIPDIQHEYFPEFFTKDVLAARRRAFAYALSCGGAIATMTDHSRDTIVKNRWTITDDVFLMPAALPEELRAEPADGTLPEEARAFDQFFYMPANIWLHKNHHRLFEAFRDAQPLLPANTGLVLTGSPDGFIDAIKDFEDLPIVHLGFVSHEEVAALFREATALVYFSLFEGFGMPLLEAFNHGTPVLCSDVTSLPEVGGDAVLSCDPTDVSAMTLLMSRIVNEDGLRESLSAKAKKRLAAYNWAAPAHSLRAAVDRVSHAPGPKLQRPLLSIVMPTRNHAHFIKASIDSVLSQGYENVELLVMDGNSTDDTVEILKSYGDKIRWISEADKGQADAINNGMQKISGDILAYLNSDDILLPGALEKAVDYFNDHPECDMVYGNADYIDEDGNITGVYATADFTFDRLMQDCCVCQPAAFWRRRIAERTGPFNAELQTAMDYDYWLRIASGGGIIRHTSDKLAQSRLHKDAKTLAMRGKIFEEVFDICKEHGGYVSYSYYNGLWSYRLYESWAGGATFRQILPGAYRLPAALHFSGQLFRITRKRHDMRSVAYTAFRVVDRRSPAIGTIFRKAWRKSSTLRRGFS